MIVTFPFQFLPYLELETDVSYVIGENRTLWEVPTP